MTIKKFGSAQWTGSLKEGQGHVSTESGVLKSQPYSFDTRFAAGEGTNPEELIGAAHAACFTMALSNILGEAGFTADTMETKATVSVERQPTGFAITLIELHLHAVVPGLNDAQLVTLATKAKEGCPVSKALSAVPIALTVTSG